MDTITTLETLETNEQSYQRIVSGLRRYREQTGEAMRLVAEAHERKIWELHGLKSFREFCEQECGFTRQWGYSLLNTYGMIRSLTEGSDDDELILAAETISPTAARMLEPYNAEERAALVKRAALSGEVTGKSVAEAIRGWERHDQLVRETHELLFQNVENYLNGKDRYERLCEICTPEFLRTEEENGTLSDKERAVFNKLGELGYPPYEASWDFWHPTRKQELERYYEAVPESEQQRCQKILTEHFESPEYFEFHGEAVTGSVAEQQVAFERGIFIFNCKSCEEDIQRAVEGMEGNRFDRIRALLVERAEGSWEPEIESEESVL